MRTPDLEKEARAKEFANLFKIDNPNSSIGEIAAHLMSKMGLVSLAMGYYWEKKTRAKDTKLVVKAKEAYAAKRVPVAERDLSGFFPEDYHCDWWKEVYGSGSSK